jgi:hypothetical protein
MRGRGSDHRTRERYSVGSRGRFRDDARQALLSLLTSADSYEPEGGRS